MSEKYGYQDFDYIIERQITVEDTPKVKDYSKQGLYFYIIKNSEQKFRFAHITTRYHLEGEVLHGKALHFRKTPNLDRQINYEIKKDLFGEDYIRFSDRNKAVHNILPKEIFFKEKKTEKGSVFLNQHRIHTKKVTCDKQLWFIGELRKTRVSNHKKRIMKELLNGAELDVRIEKVIKSQLFVFRENTDMYQNDHSIVLTQGGTGKSSILGILGKNLDNTSNAGIYGYYSVKTDTWNSGIVSQTNRPILVDECNEIINSMTSKQEGILNTLNKPLENGTYSYGKAGGRTIRFCNKFIFLGNISSDFHFENFITGLALNPLTIGRRFGYIIYDDKLHFVQGGKRPLEPSQYISTITEFLSFSYEYFSKVRHLDQKLFISHRTKKIINDAIPRLTNKTRNLELEGTRNFLSSFIKSSLQNRLPCMAFKLAIFENINDLIKTEDIQRFQSSKIADQFHPILEHLILDIETSIENIVQHQDNLEIQDTDSRLLHNEYSNLSKYQQELIKKIAIIYNSNKSVYGWTEIPDKGNLKYYVKNLKNRTGYPQKQSQILQRYGLGIYLDESKDGIYFRVTNHHAFKRIKHCIENEISKETRDIPEVTDLS